MQQFAVDRLTNTYTDCCSIRTDCYGAETEVDLAAVDDLGRSLNHRSANSRSHPNPYLDFEGSYSNSWPDHHLLFWTYCWLPLRTLVAV